MHIYLQEIIDEKRKKAYRKKLKRKEQFEILKEDMQKNGYKEKNLTIGILQANIGAIFIMLPFVVATAIFYFSVNSLVLQEISLKFSILLLPILLALIVLHELIHGLVWGFFAGNHFDSIEFGVIWKALTPYCTCSEPMKKWQYILGGAMPTLVLGGGTAVIAVVTGHFLLFFLAELMIFSGG